MPAVARGKVPLLPAPWTWAKTLFWTRATPMAASKRAAIRACSREGQTDSRMQVRRITTCRQTRATIRCPGGRRSRYSSSVQNSSMKRSEWHVAGGARVKEHYPSQSAGSIQIPGRLGGRLDIALVASSQNACAALCLRQDRPRGIRDRPQHTWRRAHSERWHSTGITGGRCRSHRSRPCHRGSRDDGRRVKTLHPAIHAGHPGDRSVQSHLDDLVAQDITQSTSSYAICTPLRPNLAWR